MSLSVSHFKESFSNLKRRGGNLNVSFSDLDLSLSKLRTPMT